MVEGALRTGERRDGEDLWGLNDEQGVAFLNLTLVACALFRFDTRLRGRPTFQGIR
jgi:hypothetical protein